MKLTELINDVEIIKVIGDADADVRNLVYNSAEAEKGSCFVAIRGMAADGEKFISDAISRGASAIVSERNAEVPGHVANVIVPNARRAMAKMSTNFFRDPSRFLTLVGITGTNGKTTITYLLESIFKAAGRNPGVIGTIDYRFRGLKERACYTTPESVDLQGLLCKMRESAVDVCAMEVSSHALSQERVAGCHFDAAVFTNLTPEHLDYHESMEDYFAAKAILFENLIAESEKPHAFAVVNGDDPYGRMLLDRCRVPVCVYGFKSNTDVCGKDMRFDSSGIEMAIYTPRGSFECISKLCGRFNAQNILAAAAVADKLGISLDDIKGGIESVSAVPGRFESIKNNMGVLALVDYAHTPDALENVLKHARELADEAGGKLITVFGCGGDRDRTKRPLMGRVVGTLADIALITSDNPRTERPESIIEEILPGIREVLKPFAGESGYEVFIDRRLAIGRAVELADKGDVIVVAGKGHEDYQIFGTKRVHFDDREVLCEILETRN